jgi:hypothetical protein
MGAFNFALGTPQFNPSTPEIPSSAVDFTSLGSAIPYLVNTGLKVYSTVAANNNAGTQVTNGQQPTALSPFYNGGVVLGPSASQINGTGLLSTFQPGTWLLIGILLVVLFVLKK